MLNKKLFFQFLIIFLVHFKILALTSKGLVSAEFGFGFLKTHLQNIETTDSLSMFPQFSFQIEVGTNEKSAAVAQMSVFNKQYLRYVNTEHTVEKTSLVRVGLGYRHWFFKSFALSFLIDSDYSYGQSHLDFSTLSTPSEYPTSAHDTVEYGIEIKPLVILSQTKETSLGLEPHYYFSATAKEHEKANDFGLTILYRTFWK